MFCMLVVSKVKVICYIIILFYYTYTLIFFTETEEEVINKSTKGRKKYISTKCIETDSSFDENKPEKYKLVSTMKFIRVTFVLSYATIYYTLYNVHTLKFITLHDIHTFTYKV